MTQNLIALATVLFMFFLVFLFIRRKSTGRRIISTVCTLTLLCNMFVPVFTVFAENESENDTEYCQQNFELYPNEQETDKTVTLDGIMPKDATAEAVDVTQQVADLNGFSENNSDTEDTENQNSSVLVAYDITITDSNREEYQPEEDKPIYVEIVNPAIGKENVTELWHIKDDSTQELITHFTVEEGKISFYAKGFSVYAVVAPNNINQVSSSDELTGDRSGSGFYLHYDSSKSKNYFRETVNTANGVLNETTSRSSAAKWFFETEDGYYKVYTLVSDVKKYIHNTGTGASDFQIELSETEYDLFELSKSAAYSFYFKKKDENKYLQHSGSGNGIRYYNTHSSANSEIIIDFVQTNSSVDDLYELDGKTYGLMNYTSGTVGNALMATDSPNYFAMMSLIVKEDGGRKTLYVAEDSDITLWTFHRVGTNRYRISTQVDGVTKYMNISSEGVFSLVDSEASGTKITIAGSVSGSTANKIRLTAYSSYTITFGEDGFYLTAPTSNNNKQWLNLVELSGLTNEDYITYVSDKVGVSDSQVVDDTSVIVYTRIWNDDRKTYEFYAVDHDGTLYPCYERGDHIMWIGHRINTLLWKFQEYLNDDGSPTDYYELYNPYSRKYIAPNIENGITVSDTKIGINMPGRRDGEYHTTLIAWDNAYYAYAGIQANTDNDLPAIFATQRSHASTFYFAMVESATAELTKVPTLDNHDYGITMKMIDFPDQNASGKTSSDVQNYFLNDASWKRRQATLNLLSTNLEENGYPNAYRGNLSSLFAGAEEVNHLFIKSIYESSGYFEFDSCQNYATLIKESDGAVGTNFTVYKELGTTNGATKSTLQHGQFLPYNTIKAGEYSTASPENLYGALADPNDSSVALLDDSDPRKYEKLHLAQGAINYYNGMEMSASFIQTPSGKDAWGHDIIFEFTGDDDFWLYVDNELVIDLGGIHSALQGTVNFSTGDVHLGGRGTQTVEVFRDTTLRQLFKENYQSRINPETHIQYTEAEVNDILDGIFVLKDGHYVFKDYSYHTMKIFYMERGAGASNLYMRFNLNYVNPGHVMLTKELTGAKTPDFDLVQYPYQIWYRMGENEQPVRLQNNDGRVRVSYQNSTQQVEYRESYTPPGTSETYQSVYLLYPGKSVEISFPEHTYDYKVIECGLNSEIYQNVDLNQEALVNIPGDDEHPPEIHIYPLGSDRTSYDSGWLLVKENPSIVYENHVTESALRTLRFKKELFDETYDVTHANALLEDTSVSQSEREANYNNYQNAHKVTAQQDGTTFDFRLFLSNGADDILELANMCEYCVKSPNGYLCRWDVATQSFVETDKTSYAQLTETDKQTVCFETSMNGAISKIPAEYTVEVPNLPAGMKFRVEERESEIPLGYNIVEYKCEGNTYTVDGSQNTGWVKGTQTPFMTVANKRGFGLKANKLWSDSDFTKSHDTFYTAVYIKDTSDPDNLQYHLINNTVKQVKHPDTSVRYFFDSLEPGTVLENYVIYEVELTNPVLDDDGNLTGYDGISKIIYEEAPTVLGATSKLDNTHNNYSYVAEYDTGTPQQTANGAAADGNVRTDTITNVRDGGLVISLYRMNTDPPQPLVNGVFTLKQGDTLLGKFTSDAHGKITILYDFVPEVEYTLTETNPPDGYIGLPQYMSFKVKSDNSVEITSSNNTEHETWDIGYKSPKEGDKLVAYIDVFNKPFILKALKIDGTSEKKLSGAEFALHRRVQATGGATEDDHPVPGYESLISDENGVIPQIDNTLPSGTYYLKEISPPSHYIKAEKDIQFTITNLGVVTIDSKEHEHYLTADTDEDGNYVYTISIPNSRENELKLTHSVNADNVNVGLKLETMGIANKDVFDVQIGTKYMQAGAASTVSIPIGGNFTRKSPNFDYVESNPEYAHKTPLTEVTKKTDTLQIKRTSKVWNPLPEERKNVASGSTGYTDIKAYYKWTDVSKQLNLDGTSTGTTSITGKGVGIPHNNGTVSLLYGQTATFNNQFPTVKDSENHTPVVAFRLKQDLQVFKTTNDDTTGIIDLYNKVVSGTPETPPLARQYSQFYTTEFTLSGGTYTGNETFSYAGYTGVANKATAKTTGCGEFTINHTETGTVDTATLTYKHIIKTGSVTISKKLDGVISDKDTQGRKKAYTFIISYKNLFGYHNPESTIDNEPWTYAERLHGTLSGTDADGTPYNSTNNSLDVAEGGRFTLVDGASVTFTGIPVGTVLRVEELSETIPYAGSTLQSAVKQVVFSGVVGEGGLGDSQQHDYTGENQQDNLIVDEAEITENDTTKMKYTVNTGNYQMTNQADWQYEVHNIYHTKLPVMYRYIDRHIVNGKPTDLRDNYTYFTNGSSIDYTGITEDNGTLILDGATKTAVCDSAPNIINVLCNYDLNYDAHTHTDGVYYDEQNTFYRNKTEKPSGTTHSQFDMQNVTVEVNNIINTMYSDTDGTAYALLKENCVNSFATIQEKNSYTYQKDEVLGLKDALRSIIDKAAENCGSALEKPSETELRAALNTGSYFYVKDGQLYIVRATYANTLRMYDVNVQLIVPNALDPATNTLSEIRNITVDGNTYTTGDYVTIKYSVPFNGITNLGYTQEVDGTVNADGDFSKEAIRSLELSEACKELYHIRTSDDRELYFGYWERIVNYNDGNVLKTTFTPVSTNFNYHYRVNDHVTIRAVYQEAEKEGTETDDSRKRYEPGKTFDTEEEFVPFDNARTIERLYSPIKKKTRVIFWEKDENGVIHYMDNSGNYTIDAQKVTGLTNYNDRFYQEAYDAKYGTGVVNIRIQEEDWQNATVNDTGSHLNVSGTSTEPSSVGDEMVLYQVSYMVPNEQEQVGYAASATDRTYNNYSKQVYNKTTQKYEMQNYTRVDVIFGGVGSEDSDTKIEQVGYVLFQSPKEGENARYGNAETFRNAVVNGTLKERLESVSGSVSNQNLSPVSNVSDFDNSGYNVRINMTKVTMHTGSTESDANTGGAVLTNKNRVNIVFDIPNNESTKKSFYTCYTVMKIQDNNGNSVYRISETPVTFNLLEADIITENKGKRTYFMNTVNGTNSDTGYLSSNYTTAVEGRTLRFTPHFLETTEGGITYTGEFDKVTIGTQEFTTAQIEQLNHGEDVEIIFDPSVYLNDPLSESSFKLKADMIKRKV